MDVPVYFFLNLCVNIAFAFSYNKLEKETRTIGFYSIYCLFVELAAWLYSFILYKSNHWIYNLFTVSQILFLVWFYRKQTNNKSLARISGIFLLVYPILFLANILTLQPVKVFHTYTYLLGNVFVLFIFLSYFDSLLKKSETVRLTAIPLFWFTIGNCIYFIGSFFYLGSINYILDSDLDRFGKLINYFVYSFTSLQYIFYLIAILCHQIRALK
jgi:hypothetical protein